MKKQKKNPSAVAIADDPSHVRSEISVSFRRIFPPIYRPVRSLFDGFERGAMSFLAASVSKLIDEFEFHQISHSKWRNKRVVTGLNSALFRKSEKRKMKWLVQTFFPLIKSRAVPEKSAPLSHCVCVCLTRKSQRKRTRSCGNKAAADTFTPRPFLLHVFLFLGKIPSSTADSSIKLNKREEGEEGGGERGGGRLCLIPVNQRIGLRDRKQPTKRRKSF